MAVLPVILFHAGFESFAGGYVGVDVFFVISGYLITGIIYSEIRDGTFSLIRFYERRARRILPALLFVCLISIPFAWLWMLPDELRDFAESLVAVSLFASNFLFWMESGYFDQAAGLKPLLHTWSLAIEEQFYLFFPLLLLLFRRLRRSGVALLLITISASSFVLAEELSGSAPSTSFYLLPTRIWELGAGALVAITAPYWGKLRHPALEVLAGLGLASILFAVFTFDESLPFPGAWALFPVLGTALVIVTAKSGTLVAKLLSLRPLVGIGLISYSAYLWHQPLFAFARLRSLEAIPVWGYLVLASVSLGLAYFSWRFVEQPFRNRQKVSRKQVFSAAVTVSTIVICIGLAGDMGRGFPGRLTDEALAAAATSRDVSPYRERCHAKREETFDLTEACRLGEGERRPLIVWGDSHGVELAWQLSLELGESETPVVQFTRSACIPVAGVYRPSGGRACPQFNDLVLGSIEAAPRGDTVLLIGRWAMALEPEPFDNGEGGVETVGPGSVFLPLGKPRSFIDDPARVSEVGALIRETVWSLLERGKRVILVYHVPEVGWDVPRHLARLIVFGAAAARPLSTSRDVFSERAARAYRELDRIPDHPNLLRIKPEYLFCNLDGGRRCRAESAAGPLYFDEHHLSGLGAGLLAREIVAAMNRKGWLASETAPSPISAER